MLTQSLQTQRLMIRPLVSGDWRAVYAYTSDPNVMTWIPEGVFTEAQAQEFVAENQSEERRAYALVRMSDGAFIGHMLFHPWFAPRTYEVGWVLHSAYHGHGYATEAAYALLEYGFDVLKLHRIIATCQPENIASYRVMEKIGMRREGHFQKCIYRDDNIWWSEYFYALLDEEWAARKKL